MISDYLIVSKKILPAFFEKVVEAKRMIESKEVRSVQEAIEQVGISRSTYYKYKDYIFRPSEDFAHRFTLSMRLKDEAGVLSEILKCVSNHRASVLTIHQDVPINQSAVVVMTLDGREMDASVDELKESLISLSGVNLVELMAME